MPSDYLPSPAGGRRQVHLYTDTVQRLYRKEAVVALQKLFPKIFPSDLANILAGFPEEDTLKLFHMIPSSELAAATLKQMPDDLQFFILRSADQAKMIAVLEELPADDRADLLGHLDPETAQRFLRGLDEDSLKEVEGLMQYSADTAGGIMVPEFFALPEYATVGEAIEAVRDVATIEMVFYLYVLDENRRLVGVSSLRQLILSDPHKSLKEIMNTRLVHVETGTRRSEIVDIVRHYRLLALPVVDDMGVLVGLVTVDDVFEAIEQEATDDMLKMAGGSGRETEHSTFSDSFRARVPLLLLALLGGVATSYVMDSFFDAGGLGDALVLATFIPVVMNMVGQVGALSAAVSLRGLMSGALDWDHAGSVLLKELGTGLVLGLVYGLASGGLAWFLFGTPVLEKIVGVTVFVNTTLAATLSRALPLVFERVGRDPSLVPGPLLGSLLDVLGVVNYFLIARWFLAA